MTEITDRSTIAEAKQELRDGWHEGLECPVCTQFVKIYKRKITSSMAYTLILMYRYFKKHRYEEWVHMNDYLNSIEGLPGAIRNTGDNAKLRYWGLLEEKPEVRNDGSKRAGYWRITELGKKFVEGEVTVQSHTKIFNSKTYGLIGETIGIKDALSNKFSYDELMKA